MKWIIRFVFVIVLSAIAYGIYLNTQDYELGERYIGLGVLGLTFVLMPLFLVHRYKDKSLSDYRLPPNFFENLFKEDNAKKKY